MKRTITYIIDLEFSKNPKILLTQLEEVIELGEEIDIQNIELRKFIASKIEKGIQQLKHIDPTQSLKIWEERLQKVRPTWTQRLFSWWK